MNIGLGLDFSLGMTFDDQQTLAREAAELGYTSLWTPEGAGLDSFQLCALRWRASADMVEGGIGTGNRRLPDRLPVADRVRDGRGDVERPERREVHAGNRLRRHLPGGDAAAARAAAAFNADDDA